jgi:transposase
MEVLYLRCAGLDVHKDSVVAGVRLAGDGPVRTKARTFGTTTPGLPALSAWLAEPGCTRLAMEATGVYWRPVWHVLSSEWAVHTGMLAHIRTERPAALLTTA